MSYVVHVGHDVEQGAYHVLSSDIPGLNVEARSFEDFVDITRDLAPDLVAQNVTGASIRFQPDIVLAA